MYAFICIAVFVLAYALTIAITSIGYHRALAHGAIELRPGLRKALVVLGPWLTGFDAKTWVVMHRRHHQYSDTPEDPHSPVNTGFLGLFKAQYDAYTTIQNGLMAGDPEYTSIARDVDLAWPTRTGRFWAPYVLHGLVAVVVGLSFGWWLALALLAGSLSHIGQGAIINYFGHAVGGRNFDLPDNSRNNHVAAWLVLGEGFQNNHHRYPSSARFSYRPLEVDLGYGICRVLHAVGLVKIRARTLMPKPGAAASALSAVSAAASASMASASATMSAASASASATMSAASATMSAAAAASVTAAVEAASALTTSGSTSNN